MTPSSSARSVGEGPMERAPTATASGTATNAAATAPTMTRRMFFIGATSKTCRPSGNGSTGAMFLAHIRHKRRPRTAFCHVRPSLLRERHAYGRVGLRPRTRPTMAEIRNSATATKNTILAASMATPATPPKPSTAATSATIRKVTAHPIMTFPLHRLRQSAVHDENATLWAKVPERAPQPRSSFEIHHDFKRLHARTRGTRLV